MRKVTVKITGEITVLCNESDDFDELMDNISISSDSPEIIIESTGGISYEILDSK